MIASPEQLQKFAATSFDQQMSEYFNNLNFPEQRFVTEDPTLIKLAAGSDVIVRFDVLKSGEIANLEITRSSGIEALDLIIEHQVIMVSGSLFKPLPADAPDSLKFEFAYHSAIGPSISMAPYQEVGKFIRSTVLPIVNQWRKDPSIGVLYEKLPGSELEVGISLDGSGSVIDTVIIVPSGIKTLDNAIIERWKQLKTQPLPTNLPRIIHFIMRFQGMGHVVLVSDNVQHLLRSSSDDE